MLINKLLIVGVGLIGGSLARALKRAGECGTVIGYGRKQSNLDKAVKLGVIDGYTKDLAGAAAEVDVIVLATPLLSFRPLLEKLTGHLKPGAIITDAGSTKASVVKDARDVLGDDVCSFIPAHPIAGTEQSGVEASFAELFQDHLVILTPIPENRAADVELVTRMWSACGAHAMSMSVEAHDLILGATSHLPHVLAFALVDCLANMDGHEDIFRFSAGGFRDFTRIASSSPEMWSDICVSNRENLIRVIGDFRNNLDKVTALVESGDKEGLKQLFSHAKEARDLAVDTRVTGKKR